MIRLVHSVISGGEALRDDPNNGCGGDYVLYRSMKSLIAKELLERRTSKSFLSFDNFQAKFYSLLYIFWYSIFLYS